MYQLNIIYANINITTRTSSLTLKQINEGLVMSATYTKHSEAKTNFNNLTSAANTKQFVDEFNSKNGKKFLSPEIIIVIIADVKNNKIKVYL